MTEAVKKLSDKEIESLREVKVNLDVEGLAKAWYKLTYKIPFGAYQRVARKIEGASKKMMTGNASVIGFPLGIILRNTSRTAHNSTSGGYSWPARTAGAVGAALFAVGVAWYGAPVIAGAIGLGAFGTGLGWLASVTAGAVSALPAFSATTLAVSTATAAVVAGLSTLVSAPLNLIVGWRRTKASLKGNKLTQDQIAEQEEAFDRRSPTVKYQNELIEQVEHGLKKLPHAKKEQFYTSLKAEFEAAQNDDAAKATAKAAPAAKTATPKASA